MSYTDMVVCDLSEHSIPTVCSLPPLSLTQVNLALLSVIQADPILRGLPGEKILYVGILRAFKHLNFTSQLILLKLCVGIQLYLRMSEFAIYLTRVFHKDQYENISFSCFSCIVRNGKFKEKKMPI